MKICQGLQSKEDLHLVLSIIKGFKWNPDEKEMRTIELALGALEGKVNSLALFADAVLFDSEKSTCEFLISIATSRVRLTGDTK